MNPLSRQPRRPVPPENPTPQRSPPPKPKISLEQLAAEFRRDLDDESLSHDQRKDAGRRYQLTLHILHIRRALQGLAEARQSDLRQIDHNFQHLAELFGEVPPGEGVPEGAEAAPGSPESPPPDPLAGEPAPETGRPAAGPPLQQEPPTPAPPMAPPRRPARMPRPTGTDI